MSLLYNNAFYAVAEKKKQLPDSFEPVVIVTTRRMASPGGDGGIEIKVSDNGNGITDAIAGKIFQPFFTTKPTGQGTGLGLSLSYDIITKGHSGELKMDKSGSEGAVFLLWLPIKEK